MPQLLPGLRGMKTGVEPADSAPQEDLDIWSKCTSRSGVWAGLFLSHRPHCSWSQAWEPLKRWRTEYAHL
jgi:hypothetical protein